MVKKKKVLKLLLRKLNWRLSGSDWFTFRFCPASCLFIFFQRYLVFRFEVCQMKPCYSKKVLLNKVTYLVMFLQSDTDLF